MLRRARWLQSAFDTFCAEFNLTDIKMDKDEWRQVDYILSIPYPFFKFTLSLSATTDVTIHNVFGIYNTLFTHIDKAKAQLARKRVGWKKVMKSALDYARDKLAEYYGKTDDVPGDLYVIATILGPRNKLVFFLGKDWEPHWAPRYRKSLETYIQPYPERYKRSPSTVQSMRNDISDINILVTPIESLQSETTATDELTRYLGSSKPIPPLLYLLMYSRGLPYTNLTRYYTCNSSSVLEGTRKGISYSSKPRPRHPHYSS
jgi:hypothetical protein